MTSRVKFSFLHPLQLSVESSSITATSSSAALATMSTRALANMMLSGEFSDLKFVSQGHEIKVHKAVVCGQSPVIKAAVQGEFEVCL